MERNQLRRLRKHISVGYLVYSTNQKQQSCCRTLTIAHKYERLTNKRISREVVD